MNNADTRAAIKAAIDTVDGLAGFLRRPAAPRPFDAWPLWRGAERADASLYLNTWAVVVVLPTGTDRADEYADQIGPVLEDALPLYVESIVPANLAAESGEIPALMITGRVE